MSNAAPIGIDDNLTTLKNKSLTINPALLLANDSDPDGEILSLVSVQSAVNGVVSVQNGQIVFVPTTGYLGAASFTYTITDNVGGFVTATVKVNVVSVLPKPAPTLDTIFDDVLQQVGNVAPNGYTNDTKPTFGGTGVAGDIVKIMDGGKAIGSATVDKAGNWTFTPKLALAEGPHTITVQGKTTDVSSPRVFTVDTKAPLAPILNSVDDNEGSVTGDVPQGGKTDDTTPTFGGTGEPGSVITVKDGTTVLGTTTVDSGGTWSLTPATPLADGLHSVTATATDKAGNTSPATAPRQFTVDTKVAVPTPTIDGVNDDVGPITGNVPANGSTNDNQPTFSGSAGPGSVVTVRDNGVPLGSATAGADGKWSLTPVTPLVDGPHSVTAQAGPGGPESAPRPFTIDTKPPGVPLVFLTTDLNDDGFILADELSLDGGRVSVSVELPKDAQVGDTLLLVDQGGVVVQRVLTATDLVAGTVEIPGAFAAPADGQTITVQANLVDKAGNVSGEGLDSAVIKLGKPPAAPTIDIVQDDVAPVTGDVPANGSTNDNRPTFSGSADPNSVVIVKDNGVPIGSTTAGPTGIWSLTPVTPLADGPHSITAQAGPGGPESAPRPFTVDTKAPVAPTLDGVNDDVAPVTGDVPPNGSTNDNRPTFSGTAEPNSVVTVKDGGVPIGTVTVGPDGKWSLTPVTPLADGPHSVTAQATDKAGNTGPESAPRPFTVDTKAPVAPTLDGVNDDVAPVTGDVPPNGSTNDNRPTFSGTAEPNSVVTVKDGGVPIGTVTAGPDGKWSLTPVAPLADGPHSVTAQATDKAGNTGPDSAPRPFTVDTKAPIAPTLDTVNDDVAPVTGNVPQGGTTDDTTPTFAGTAEPNSVVTVKDGPTVIGSTTADPAGNWSLTPVTPLANGPHSVTATATDKAGNESPATAPRDFTIDTRGATGAPTVTITEDTNNDGFINAAELNGPVGVRIALPAGAQAGDSLEVFTLIGDVGSFNSITLTAANIAAGGVDLSLASPGEGGKISVDANIRNAAGLSPTGSDSAVVDTKAPVAPTLDGVNDDVAPITGDVPPNGTTNDNRPTFSGTAEPNSVVTVKDGGVPIGTVTAGPDGKWSLTPVTPLADGPHSVTATATDPAGNTSPESAPRPFTVDTKAPVAPTLDGVNDDVAPVTGDVPPNGTTNDNRPTFSGTAEPNSVVTVKDGGVPIGTVTAEPDGKWSLTPVTPLADGPHSVTATATDPAGNTSPESAPRPFTVDTKAPVAPTLDLVNDDVAPVTGNVPQGGTTDDTTPTFVGTAEPNSVVTVKDGPTVLGSTTADPAGNWSLTPVTPLANGPHSVTATATDKAGNESAPTAPRTFTIDATGAGTTTLDTVNDDVAPITGDVPPNGSTNDNTPTFGGTAKPNSVVTVSDNGTPIGSTTTGPDGKWSLTPVTPLADGPHSVTAQAKDPAGNTSPATAPRPFTVDTVAPVGTTLDTVNDDVAPVTGEVPNGTSTNDTTPTFGGKGEPGSVVTVKDGPTVLGSTTVDPAGNWSLTPVTPLAEGPHSVTATAVDKAGNESAPTPARTFTIDTIAPLAPTLDLVNDDVAPVTGDVPPNGTTNDNKPTFSGTAEPNSVVTVKDGPTVLGTTTAGPDGKWSLTPVTPLADGPHAVTATATDPAGNESTATAPRPFTVDTVAPVGTTLDTVNDDVAPVTGEVPNGTSTNDTRPTFGGKGEPGSVVTVKDGPTVLGSTTVDPAGNWSLTPVTPLAEGPHSVTATAVDKAGNESAPTPARTFTIDTIAPLAPTLDLVNDDVAPVTGDVPPNGTTNDNKPTFSGTAEPNSVVTVKDGGVPIGTVTAGPDGKWSLTPVTPLADGPHSVTATATDPAGNESPATAPRPFIVDTVAPVGTTLDTVNDDVAPVTGEVPNGTSTNDTTPTFGGKGEPGSVVTVKDGPTVLGSTTVDPAGNWSLTPVTPLAEGPHSVTATAVDKAGNESAPTPARTFTIDTIAPLAPTLDTVNDDVAPVTGDVPPNGTTNDNKPTFSGTAEPNSVVTVKDGPTVLGTTTAGPDGKWSLTPVTPLADGPHAVTATATDPAGNESPATAPRPFTVDTKAPVAPTLDLVNDDVAPVTGNVPQGGATDDTTPTFVGTAEPNSVVTVKDGPTVLGSTTADPAGNWSLTPTTPLADGPHSVTATATDKAGNESPATAPRDFTIDTRGATGAPTVTITEDANNDGFINAAELNGLVDVRIGLPAGARAGDTLVVNSRNENELVGQGNAITLTAANIAAGGVDLSLPPPGEGFRISVEAYIVNPAGQSPVGSDSAVLDTKAPAAPTLDTVNDDVAPITGDVPPNGTTNDNRPTFGGTAEPNSVVTVKDGPTVLGSTTTGPDGKWSLTPVAPLADGPHSVTATATDPAGNTSPETAPRPFTVDTVAPVGTTLDTVNDDVAPVTGEVPNGTSTNDTTPTFGGKGEPGSVVTVKDGPTVLGSTTVDPAGNWSLTPVTPLAEGPHSVTATAVDKAGNESAPTPARSFVIDTIAPVNPVITKAIDDFGPKTGDVANGGRADDATPTLVGTSEANSVVTVKDGATVIGSTIADAAGNWQLTPLVPIATGGHAFVATAQDQAGNVSGPSNLFNYTVGNDIPGPKFTDNGLKGPMIFQAGDYFHGIEPWVTDLTSNGTTMLRDIFAGTTNSLGVHTYVDRAEFSDLGNGKAVFQAFTRTEGWEAWVTDGTAAGTKLLKDIDPSHNVLPSNNGFIALGNGKALFTAYDVVHGRELWITDGTEAGTQLVKDITPGVNPSFTSASVNHWAQYDSTVWTDITPLGGGKAVFQALTPGKGYEPWITDGTEAGTFMLKDINAGAGLSSWANQFTDLGNGKFVFTANLASTGGELWISDGTTAGTTLLKDINPGVLSSTPWAFTKVEDGKAVFWANDGTNGNELWITDGTAAGTTMLKNINPTAGVGSYDGWTKDFTALGNGQWLFSANTTANGTEPWITDLTPAGTHMLKDIAPGVAISTYDTRSAAYAGLTEIRDSYQFTKVADGWALFAPYQPFTTGQELWITNGQDAWQVADIWNANAGSIPSFITATGNGNAIFTAFEATGGGGLGSEPYLFNFNTWKTLHDAGRDTSSAVTLLKDISPVVGTSSWAQDYTVIGGGSEDSSFHLTAQRLLQGWTNADGTTNGLTVAGLTVQHGTVALQPDGTWTVTPDANFSGTMNVAYTVKSTNGGETAATYKLDFGGVTDFFKFDAADNGPVGSPLLSNLQEFNPAPRSQGGDVLDLRDMLSGETVDNLLNFLHVEKVGADTVIDVSATGQFAGGFSASLDTAKIVLNNVDLGSGTSTDLVNQLIAQNKLLVDGLV